MLKNLALAILVVAAFSGCLKKSDATSGTCSYDACAVKAPASEIQQVQAYLSTNGLTAVQHCSGMFYSIDIPGTGVSPQVCSNITVTYEGKLTNGTVFDMTSTPVTFNLSQVIAGWMNVLPQLKTGGRIHLYIPPTLGYGNRPNGSIPANSILVFRVDLIAVQ